MIRFSGFYALVRPGLHRRLLLVSLGLLSLALVAAGLYAKRGLTQDLAHRAERDLATRTQTVATALQISRALDSFESLDASGCDRLVRPLAEGAQARITVIDPHGFVRCDSSMTGAQIAQRVSHNDRPEVRQARALGLGIATHESETLRRAFVYVARRVERPHGAWIVRLAIEPMALADEQATLQRMLLLALLVALVGGAILAPIASHWVAAPVRDLTDSARGMVHDLSVRTRSTAQDEVGELARTLDELADELSLSMSTLRDERDRLATILDAMLEGVLVTDEQGVVIVANRALREMFLRTKDAAKGRSPGDAMDSRLLQEAIDEAASEQRRTAVEIAIEGVRPRIVAASIAPLQSQHGAGGRAIVAVLSDVTELRRLESMRRDFVANVSHELRTPIAAVRAATETLLTGALESPTFAREFVGMIERHAERLRRLVEDLLELSRIEAKELELRPELLDLSLECEHAVELFKLAAEHKGVTLRVTREPGVGRVFADRRALEHVLGNLIDNAIKYAGERASVVVRAGALEDRARVSVTDTGPGIEQRHLPRLFERFYRVDTGRSRALGGTGLGLAIVKHMAEAMGGRVQVESELGRGTTFTVELPDAPPQRKSVSLPPAMGTAPEVH
ncbi:MAG: ATP-binding protein [Deltaproteobacteria bacterium]|nr:ATP-binding protein [Deltaproteobacteria bacterium]